MGYQTFLNWFLKKSMDDHESFEDLLEKLEHTVFRKKALIMLSIVSQELRV